MVSSGETTSSEEGPFVGTPVRCLQAALLVVEGKEGMTGTLPAIVLAFWSAGKQDE